MVMAMRKDGDDDGDQYDDDGDYEGDDEGGDDADDDDDDRLYLGVVRPQLPTQKKRVAQQLRHR
eukprot:1815875-Pyramimonas_sp.AAC.1